MGTGLRFWGAQLPTDRPFVGHALVTHLHWDHVQGLPFFSPVLRAGSQLDVYAPPPGDSTLEEAFDEFMAPPYFPVRVADLPGEMRFHTVTDADFTIGDVRVMARSVPHIGPTNGYRIERDGMAVAYISDHQQPLDDHQTVPPAGARAVRSRRSGDPRRAVHAARVRDGSRTGDIARSTTR